MSRFFLLLKLKLADIFALRSLMLLLFILPLVFGFLTASATVANRQPFIQLAVVDEDQTEASASLLVSLKQEGRKIHTVTADQAQSLLLGQEIDGILEIKPGFSDSLAELDQAFLVYTPAPESLITTIVTEAVLITILPEYSQRALLEQLARDFARHGLEPAADLAAEFQKRLVHYREHEARLDLIFSGTPESETLAVALFDEYSLEVFFLSLFAVLGMLGLTSQPVQRRLAATSSGLWLDYITTLTALQLLGTSQILIYMVSMSWTMSNSLDITDLLLLSAFVFLMLGLGQLFVFLPANSRHFLSLILLAGSAFVGGCFFYLPQKLLQISSRFSPHGWILAALRGYRTLPFFVPLIFAAALLLLGYFKQAKMARSTD